MIFCKVRRTRGVTGAIILDRGSRFETHSVFGLWRGLSNEGELTINSQFSQISRKVSGFRTGRPQELVNLAQSPLQKHWVMAAEISPQKRLIHMCWMLQFTCCCIQIGPHQSITCTRNKILAWVIFQQLCYPILNMHGWWIWFQFWTLAHASCQPPKESVFNQSSDSLFSTNFALAVTKKPPQSNWCWLLLKEYGYVNV